MISPKRSSHGAANRDQELVNRSLRRFLIAGGMAAVGGAGLSTWLYYNAGSGVFAQTASELPAVGRVTAILGDAEARSGGSQQALFLNAPVFQGDVISTGAETRLTLALGERTTLKLGANAEIAIESYIVDAGGVIQLASGPVLFDRDPPPATDTLSFRSPYGLIAVRGTRFFAGPSNGVFGVFLERGRLDVSSGGVGVTMSELEGVDIAMPGDPPNQPHSWKKARIDAALESVQ